MKKLKEFVLGFGWGIFFGGILWLVVELTSPVVGGGAL